MAVSAQPDGRVPGELRRAATSCARRPRSSTRTGTARTICRWCRPRSRSPARSSTPGSPSEPSARSPRPDVSRPAARRRCRTWSGQRSSSNSVGWFRRMTTRARSFGRFGGRLEQLELFPRDRDVADQLPAQPTVRSGTTNLQPFGAERSSRTVRVAERDAPVGFDTLDLADDVAAAIVAFEPDGFPGSEAQPGERRR